MRRKIPNIITLLNMAAGFASVLSAIEGEIRAAAWLILLAALLDFLDGFAARLLDARTLIGKQLDSLADLCSFSVAPAVVMYFLMMQSGNTDGIWTGELILLLPALLVLAGGYRLGRFNTFQQEDQFTGMPVPAAGIFVSGLVLIIQDGTRPGLAAAVDRLWIYCICIAVLSLLMISRIPMLSLKFQNFSFAGNQIRYLFLAVSIILLVILRLSSIPFIILLYLVTGSIERASRTGQVSGPGKRTD